VIWCVELGYAKTSLIPKGKRKRHERNARKNREKGEILSVHFARIVLRFLRLCLGVPDKRF
jgi:hypothetical protein